MSRFGTRSLLRRYGEIDSRGYVIGGGRELVPVHVILDDSATLATQPIERRALIRSQRTSNAGVWSCVEIYANTPGGLVVESLVTAADGTPAAGTGRWIQIDQGTLIPAATLRSIGDTVHSGGPDADTDQSINVGGLPCRCRFAAGWAITDPVSLGGVFDGGEYAEARIYVPRQHTLRLVHQTANRRLHAAVVLRELDEVEPG